MDSERCPNYLFCKLKAKSRHLLEFIGPTEESDAFGSRGLPESEPSIVR